MSSAVAEVGIVRMTLGMAVKTQRDAIRYVEATLGILRPCLGVLAHRRGFRLPPIIHDWRPKVTPDIAWLQTVISTRLAEMVQQRGDVTAPRRPTSPDAILEAARIVAVAAFQQQPDASPVFWDLDGAS